MRKLSRAVYTFTRLDIERCMCIGRERWEVQSRGGARDQRYSSNRSSLDVSIQGVLGELAFLKLFNLDESRLEDTTFNSHGKDRGDALLDGRTIDVKCPIGLYCRRIQIRAGKTYNPPFAYCLIRLHRPSEDDPPIKQRIVGLRDSRGQLPAGLCTFNVDEDIVAHFSGFVSHDDALQNKHLREFHYGKFYCVDMENLCSWDEIIASGSSSSSSSSGVVDAGVVLLEQPPSIESAPVEEIQVGQADVVVAAAQPVGLETF